MAAMSEEAFQQFSAQLFAYLNERFDGLDKKLSGEITNVRDEVRQNQVALDHLVGRFDRLEGEYHVMNHQLTAHDAWIERAAERLKLRYDRSA